MVRMDVAWAEVLGAEFAKPYFAALERFVDAEYSAGACFPPADKIFNAFRLTPFEKVKAVIIGQDPYHEPGQAQGLAFYVPEGVRTPPSLRNIAKELGSSPNLMRWAEQGVLLMNAILTVRSGAAGSHQKHGWEEFTDAVIRELSARKENLVFILWGAYAQKKGAIIDRNKHLVIESAHPSPLSARHGFFGSRPFARTNEYLVAHEITPISF